MAAAPLPVAQLYSHRFQYIIEACSQQSRYDTGRYALAGDQQRETYRPGYHDNPVAAYEPGHLLPAPAQHRGVAIMTKQPAGVHTCPLCRKTNGKCQRRPFYKRPELLTVRQQQQQKHQQQMIRCSGTDQPVVQHTNTRQPYEVEDNSDNAETGSGNIFFQQEKTALTA